MLTTIDDRREEMDITYSNGMKLRNCVVQIWDDLHNERSGYYRAFWCDGSETSVGSPVIGYCSASGSHRTIKAVIAEVQRLYPNTECYRNGKRVR
jgi:hypothetical protein